MVAEQVTYRELLIEMTRSDLLLRYKQAILGVAWAFFMPIGNTLVFVALRRVAHFDTNVPYPIFVYSGLLAWHFSAAAWRFASTSLTSNVSLMTRINFPREIFPFSAVLVALVDFVVGALPLVALMFYYGIALTPAVLFLPVVLLVHIAFTTALALLLAMANLFFRDVKYVFEIAVSVWMFASGVVYPVHEVPGPLGAVMRANPMTPIVDGYRDVLMRGVLPDMQTFASVGALSLVAFVAVWFWFHSTEPTFAEVV